MSDQIETLPQCSRRLATIIPASHWMSIGYSPEAAHLCSPVEALKPKTLSNAS